MYAKMYLESMKFKKMYLEPMKFRIVVSLSCICILLCILYYRSIVSDDRNSKTIDFLDYVERIVRTEDTQKSLRKTKDSTQFRKQLLKNFKDYKTNHESCSNDATLPSVAEKVYPGFKNCRNLPQTFRIRQWNNHWVLENYITPHRTFDCDGSITYTTHAEYNLLHNLEEVTARWQGPVSVAVYTPGSDFEEALKTILYLRSCNENVINFVTFHLFFPVDQVPSVIPPRELLLARYMNCAEKDEIIKKQKNHRQKNNLKYPINIARNIAKEKATTFFQFYSDIELYPSKNVIPEFLKMMNRPDVSNSEVPRVYVLPVFEIYEDTKNVPENKMELVKSLKNGPVTFFYKFRCDYCHKTPKLEEWMEAENTTGLRVFHVGKRTDSCSNWEPFFIGTSEEPVYEERLNSEGNRNRHIEAYILCVKNYDFHILDNAFVVHRPGIKREGSKIKSTRISNEKSSEYENIYGENVNCQI